ncbi:hypothetical protein Dimus_008189 [Dionaea muscipula]
MEVGEGITSIVVVEEEEGIVEEEVAGVVELRRQDSVAMRRELERREEDTKALIPSAACFRCSQLSQPTKKYPSFFSKGLFFGRIDVSGGKNPPLPGVLSTSAATCADNLRAKRDDNP